jgi:acetyltransferase EpsM
MANPEARANIESVVIFGSRGGGAVAAQALRNPEAGGSPQRLLGYLDDELPVDSMRLGAPVLGPFSSWKDLPEGIRFVAPLHKAGHMVERAARIRSLGVPDERWTTLLDPRAEIPADFRIGNGCLLSAYAACQPGVRVGNHVAIRSGAGVAHDCTLADFVFVGINAALCGYASVGEGAHISPGATVRENVRIGAWALVGLGAVVIGDVPEGAIVAGNPARPIGSVSDR